MGYLFQGVQILKDAVISDLLVWVVWLSNKDSMDQSVSTVL